MAAKRKDKVKKEVVSFNLRMQPELASELDRIAKDRRRTRTGLINDLLHQFVDEIKEQEAKQMAVQQTAEKIILSVYSHRLGRAKKIAYSGKMLPVDSGDYRKDENSIVIVTDDDRIILYDETRDDQEPHEYGDFSEFERDYRLGHIADYIAEAVYHHFGEELAIEG